MPVDFNLVSMKSKRYLRNTDNGGIYSPGCYDGVKEKKVGKDLLVLSSDLVSTNDFKERSDGRIILPQFKKLGSGGSELKRSVSPHVSYQEKHPCLKMPIVKLGLVNKPIFCHRERHGSRVRIAPPDTLRERYVMSNNEIEVGKEDAFKEDACMAFLERKRKLFGSSENKELFPTAHSNRLESFAGALVNSSIGEDIDEHPSKRRKVANSGILHVSQDISIDSKIQNEIDLRYNNEEGNDLTKERQELSSKIWDSSRNPIEVSYLSMKKFNERRNGKTFDTNLGKMDSSVIYNEENAHISDGLSRSFLTPEQSIYRESTLDNISELDKQNKVNGSIRKRFDMQKLCSDKSENLEIPIRKGITVKDFHEDRKRHYSKLRTLFNEDDEDVKNKLLCNVTEEYLPGLRSLPQISVSETTLKPEVALNESKVVTAKSISSGERTKFCLEDTMSLSLPAEANALKETKDFTATDNVRQDEFLLAKQVGVSGQQPKHDTKSGPSVAPIGQKDIPKQTSATVYSTEAITKPCTLVQKQVSFPLNNQAFSSNSKDDIVFSESQLSQNSKSDIASPLNTTLETSKNLGVLPSSQRLSFGADRPFQKSAGTSESNMNPTKGTSSSSLNFNFGTSQSPQNLTNGVTQPLPDVTQRVLESSQSFTFGTSKPLMNATNGTSHLSKDLVNGTSQPLLCSSSAVLQSPQNSTSQPSQNLSNGISQSFGLPKPSHTMTLLPSQSSIFEAPKHSVNLVNGSSKPHQSSMLGVSQPSLNMTFGSSQSSQSSIFEAPKHPVNIVNGTSQPPQSSVLGVSYTTLNSTFGTVQLSQSSMFGTSKSPINMTFGMSQPSMNFTFGTSQPSQSSVIGTSHSSQSSVIGTLQPSQSLVIGTSQSSQGSMFGTSKSPVNMTFGASQPSINFTFGTSQSSQSSVIGTSQPSQSSMFETSKSPVNMTFGTSQPSINFTFGTPQSSQSSVIGTSQLSQSSMFGTLQPSQSSVIGTSQSSQSSMFGTSKSPVNMPFGTSVIGTSQSSQNKVFGTLQSSQSSVIGTSQSSQSSMFGTSQTPVSMPFGTSQPSQNPVFGTLQPSMNFTFGTLQPSQSSVIGTSQSSQSSMFGTSQTPVSMPFGTSQPSQNPMFGTSQPSISLSFGTSVIGTSQSSQNKVFGTLQSSQSSVIGTSQSSQNSIFGTSQSPVNLTFGNPQLSQNPMFGTSQPSQSSMFGSSQPSINLTFGTLQSSQNTVFVTSQPSQSSVIRNSQPSQNTIFGTSQPPQSSMFGTLQPISNLTFGGMPSAQNPFGTLQPNQGLKFGSSLSQSYSSGLQMANDKLHTKSSFVPSGISSEPLQPFSVPCFSINNKLQEGINENKPVVCSTVNSGFQASQFHMGVTSNYVNNENNGLNNPDSKSAQGFGGVDAFGGSSFTLGAASAVRTPSSTNRARRKPKR